MEVQLLSPQFNLLTSDSKVAALVGGIGAGKSFTLAHFVLNQIINFPEAQGLIVANTYTQLANATIPAVTNLFDELGLKYNVTMSGAKKHITVGSSVILIYSLEQYENIRGIEVGFLAGDEIAYAKREALDVIFGRLRDKRGSLQARFFTSPNGFNWFYDYCNNSDVELHRIKTADNKYLPEEYYNNLLQMYGGPDSPLARQELFGEFINQTASSVYFAFNRTNHVQAITSNPHLPVYVGCDFNAGNMNYVAAQYEIQKGFTVLESINLKDHAANTFSMAQEIWSKYGTRAIVIPDATANSRKTSAEAGITDIKILQATGLQVRLSSSNPRIKDRQNTVNILFHKNRIKINPSCNNLIKELETLANNDDEGKVSHLAVALGYVCYKLEPLKIEQNTQPITNPFLFKKAK